MAKQYGKVELQSGAITPVTRGLWHSASEKLHEAALGITQMESATDRIEYESGWTHFVDSLEEFWSRFFDEGKTKFTDFQPWTGALNAQRKQDPLLHYLYQARHQSQHGRIALAWEEGKLLIAPDFFGTIRDLRINKEGSFEVDANPIGGSNAQVRIVHDSGRPQLPVIENKRYKQTFAPPTVHLSQPLADMSPIHVARLGLAFCENIFHQAFAKFAPTT
jgi:hypothetical protein